MTVYDYAHSFVTFVTRGRENIARLQVESVCTLRDQASGTTTKYFFFASCKSEAVFVDRGLFSEDNYDFCGIFADEEFAIFRTRSTHTDGFREEGLWRDRFEDVRFHLEKVEGQALASNREIVQASLDHIPLIGQVEIGEGALQAVLEFPIKTMNANDIWDVYQVDTGPLAFPDFGADVDRHIERLSPAYVAYNAPDFAEFVVQQALPLVADGQEITRVTHYTKPLGIPARTQVIGIVQ